MARTDAGFRAWLQEGLTQLEQGQYDEIDLADLYEPPEEEVEYVPCPLCGDPGWPKGKHCRYVERWLRGEPLGPDSPVKHPPPPPSGLVVS